MEIREDAEVAYTAYRDHTGGVSLASGQRIPEWPELRDDIKSAWKASAHALRRTILCDVHWNLEQSESLEPFTMCVACQRVALRQLNDYMRGKSHD